MLVWCLKAYGHYGGGMAVVAAPTKDRACQIAEEARLDKTWGTDYGKPESAEQLPVTYTGQEGVLAHFETGE